MKVPRIYVDTSVFGGCFDQPFAKDSQALVQMAADGKLVLLLSDLVGDELVEAPPQVQGLIAQLHRDAIESISVSAQSEDLRDSYLREGAHS